MTSTPISLAIFCGPSLDTVNGNIENNTDKTYPCRTSVSTENHPEVFPLLITQLVLPLYTSFPSSTKTSGISPWPSNINVNKTK